VKGSSVHRNVQQSAQTTLLVYWYSEYCVHIFIYRIFNGNHPLCFL